MQDGLNVFAYRDGLLYCEEAALADIAAGAGTPCYVYSSRSILGRFRAYEEALEGSPHLICYSVKANANLAVLHLLAEAGAGFDIVSGGELYRVLKAGGRASRVVYSGAGKTAAEIEYALKEGIYSFNCESEGEISLLEGLAARAGRKARVALRVNPDVDAATHPYITTGLRHNKFGVSSGEAERIYRRISGSAHLLPEGVSFHLGSQILDVRVILEGLDRVLALAERLRAAGLPIRWLDLGGGLGIRYKPQDEAPSIANFVGQVRRRIEGRGLSLVLEPGRSIVGEGGVLLTRVLYRKRNGEREFVIVDASMTDLLRPSLYKAHHEILPARETSRPPIRADVVGPVCESGDFLAKDREIANVLPGDLLAVATAGAYGFALSSNYNARPRAAEVLVEGSSWRVTRARETYEDLIRGETL